MENRLVEGLRAASFKTTGRDRQIKSISRRTDGFREQYAIEWFLFSPAPNY